MPKVIRPGAKSELLSQPEPGTVFNCPKCGARLEVEESELQVEIAILESSRHPDQHQRGWRLPCPECQYWVFVNCFE